MTKKKSKTSLKSTNKRPVLKLAGGLLNDLRMLIDQARGRVAYQVNTELVTLYWNIGNRIKTEILKEERAEYGKHVLETLGIQLTLEYGRGFDRTALNRMVQFSELFPDWTIVAALRHKLSWTHFRELLPISDKLKRNFYTEMCSIEGWSVRTLQDKMKRMLFERTAIAKKPQDVAEQELKLLRERGEMSPDLVFRDPYLLDFLGLAGVYDEKDVESAILRELEQFILEFGKDFCFVARQKRMSVDFDNYYLDLLFYHRGLRRLIAIELKLDSFQPEHKGQMEFYLRWLEQNERKAQEESPIGLILCAGKSTKKVELMSVNDAGIHVAEYFTEALSEELLMVKLHAAIKHAQDRLASGQEPKQIR